jgi:hypothetical protein
MTCAKLGAVVGFTTPPLRDVTSSVDGPLHATFVKAGVVMAAVFTEPSELIGIVTWPGVPFAALLIVQELGTVAVIAIS